MKKVLFVITKSNAGGAQRYVYDLARNLPKTDFKTKVAFGGTGEKNASSGVLEIWLNKANIETIRIKNFMRNVSIISDIRAFFELISLFHKEHPDVIHLNSSKAVVLGALAGRIAGVPNIVGTVHGWTFNETRPWWQREVITFGHWLAVVLCHTTIVVSENDRKQVATWKMAKKIVTIHNGVSTINFKSRTDARRELGIADDMLVIGSIGELTSNKNHTSLITAAALLKKESKKVFALNIIGDGEERERLTTLAKEKGLSAVVFHGFIEHAAHLLLAYDIFVLPSKKEGLPYALLEAGRAGLAVIATNVGGIPEIIDDGKTGTLIKSDDITSFIHALVLYTQNPALRTEHGAALKEEIEKKYTLERMINETSALY